MKYADYLKFIAWVDALSFEYWLLGIEARQETDPQPDVIVDLTGESDGQSVV